jgi:cold shock CspA family protein
VPVSELFRLSFAQSGVAVVLLNVGFGEKSGHRIFAAAGGDVFVHARAVVRAGLGTLSEGQRISYVLMERKRPGKYSAEKLRPAGKGS